MLLLNNREELLLLNVLFLPFSVNTYLLGTVKSHIVLLWLEISLIIRFLLFVSSFTNRGITLKCEILSNIMLIQNYLFNSKSSLE